MKTLYNILISLLFLNSPIYSQFVGDQRLDDIGAEYIYVWGSSTSFKVFAHVDYGQKQKMYYGRDLLVRDGAGEPMAFNSIVEVLNYFHRLGYGVEHIQSDSSDSATTANYLLRRMKNDKLPTVNR